MEPPTPSPSLPWLDQYASAFHTWRHASPSPSPSGPGPERPLYYRPLGIIEYAFDTDGQHYEGRADINALWELEIATRASPAQLRERILLAWTALRLHHVLLLARATDRQSWMADRRSAQRVGVGEGERYFVVSPGRGVEECVGEAGETVVWVGDHYGGKVDAGVFCRHAQNCGRVVEAERALARLFVLPCEPLDGGKGNGRGRGRGGDGGRATLRMLLVIGHEIADGMACYTWFRHFRTLLNTPLSSLRAAIATALDPSALAQRLPAPQEDLYPPISGSLARRRWFWVLTLVLRHVRKPQPAAFPNPLYRATPLPKAQPLPPTYAKVLDYSRTPPLNTFTVRAHIASAPTKRLHRLCREAHASVGAGLFALVAIVMMSLHESQHPGVPLEERRPFIGSFPINPRAFFNHHEEPDSLMLAFSDGVVLPFLPSELPLEGRIKVLARLAHRQLARYQKRRRGGAGDGAGEKEREREYMSSRGAGRIIAMNYIAALERLEAKLPPLAKTGLNPQGELAVTPNPTMATCGVSSTGRRDPAWGPGQYDLDAPLGEGEDAFVADFRRLDMGVRARDGEFLVGIGGDDEGVGANVSFDGCAVDESMAGEWKKRMEGLLDEGLACPERARL